jgi:hypothetical protein
LDKLISTIVYASVSLSNATELGSYIEANREVMVLRAIIVIGDDLAIGAIE